MRRGEGVGLTAVEWASAVLYNGLGRYEDALAAAQQAGEHPEELRFSTWALVELIEAAARSGKAERAADALQRLSETTRASGTDWALGIEARSRALLSDGEAAERLYREAIERLGRTRVRVELARAHLLYGEWLRRERRRLDAREQLRTAHEMFTAMGIEAFAERAARELLATGETARKRTVETTRPAHRPGGPDRAARPRRPLQPRDRRPAVHQPAHRRVPPAARSSPSSTSARATSSTASSPPTRTPPTGSNRIEFAPGKRNPNGPAAEVTRRDARRGSRAHLSRA